MRLLLVFICTSLFGINCLSHAQTITTVAGTGTFGYIGDGGAALSALIEVNRICTDKSGNLYLTTNHSVRKITAAGIISTICGSASLSSGHAGDGGPASAALLYIPTGITTDQYSNIYIIDSQSAYIRKIDTNGIINTIAGNGTYSYFGEGVAATASGLNARDIVIDSFGSMYLADGANSRVRKINSSGIITTAAGNGVSSFSGDGGLATVASIYNSRNVGIDAQNNLYITDGLNNRIRKVDAAGIITTIAGTGATGFAGDGGPATAASIYLPSSIAIDGNGNIYVLSECRVRKISPTGIITTFAGNGICGNTGDGGLAKYAQIGSRDIELYGDGVLYIADVASIRMIKDDTVQFVGGAMQYINICGETNINPLLAVHDADTGQGLWWTMVSAPHHGTASVTYHDTATGGIVTPMGLTYIPASGYYGTDTFRVRVYDEMLSDTTTIVVSTYPNNAGAIAGADTVCVGNSTTLTNPIPGGVWSASNANASVSATGIVSGIATGAVVVSYTVSNPCVTTGVAHPMTVVPGDNCVSGLYTHSTSKKGMMVSPNPNNGDFSMVLSSAGRVTVTNSLGILVATAKVQQSQPYSFHLSVPGLYVITGISASGQWHEKVVVR